MPSQLDYDDGAFRYFSALMLLLYVFPGGYFAWGSYKSFVKKTSPEACTGRSKEETDILRARANKISLFTPCFVLNLVALAVSVISLCIMIPALLSEDAIAQYDPFQVLGLDDSASARDIKRAYRKLTLLYHPDKRQGHEALFIKVTKAYEALTDPVAMENFKKWGNPDGKQGFSIGLGLPGFFENEELMPVIIAGYVIVLVVVVPLVFYLLYLTFKGVEVPRMKQASDQAMYVRGHVKAFGPMYGKHRITHVVAGQADLQQEANLAAGTKRLLIPKEALEELRQTITDAAQGKRPAGDMLTGGLMAAGGAGGAGSVVSVPNKFGALWPTETGGEPVTVPHAIRTWAPTSQEEMRRGPPAVPSTRFIPAFRFGRPPNPAVRGDRGVPTSMFAPPMVLDRNHVMLWAHLYRISRSTPCFQALLKEGGGAESLDKMLVLTEQSLLLSAQVTSMGMWRHKDMILGADPPTPAQATAIMRALTKPGKKAAKKAAKKSKGGAKKAAQVQIGAGVGVGEAEADADAAPAAERLGIETGFSVDSMTDDDDVADWADAVLDLMGGIDRIKVDREGSQAAADTVRVLLMAQRVGQALPPTASPLAQLPALLRAGVNIDTLEGDIRKAVNARLDAAEAEDEDEEAASASGASPSKKASKKPTKKPSKKPSKKAGKQAPRSGEAEDATSDEDDEFTARVRSDWPQWLRLASVGWFADGGELASLAAMPPTERASLLSLHAIDHTAAQEVEAVIHEMPRVSITAQCVVKRFEMLPGMAQPRIKEQVDPFAPGTVLEENEMLSVTMQLRHTNLGSVPTVASTGAGGSAAEAAGEDDGDLDPDLADLMLDGEDEDEDEDEVLAEDDGYTLRKDKRKRRRRRAADVPDIETEPNAKTPVPEPHQPFMSRPLPKTERWAVFVCSDRGWILPAEDIWRQRRGVPQTVSTVDASTARVDVELGPRFLPGPGTHKLFLVAICLDYAGMDVVKELGTVTLDISREIPRQEKRLQTLRARSSKQMEEAEHEEAQRLAEADDSEDEEEQEDGGAKEETMFDEVAAMMRSEKQLDAEDDEDIE